MAAYFSLEIFQTNLFDSMGRLLTGLEAAYSELRFVVTEWIMNNLHCLPSLVPEVGGCRQIRNARVNVLTMMPLVSLLKWPGGSEAHCLKGRSRRCTPVTSYTQSSASCATTSIGPANHCLQRPPILIVAIADSGELFVAFLPKT